MDKTNENGITMINLIITVILIIIVVAITVETATDSEIIPSAENAQKEYNQMVENQYNEMETDKVLNLLELDG